ncbi:hypothetical protein HOA55_04700 [archaeon]|jgi:hypothetical protein|nr:hypothetical protein [archaeon]MBT6820629.1 hypothetical protein [archaeon]MBT7024961.1 hypothetical protein [archaeon]MBT7238580.1 hypothetical protein [archaeon]
MKKYFTKSRILGGIILLGLLAGYMVIQPNLRGEVKSVGAAINWEEVLKPLIADDWANLTKFVTVMGIVTLLLIWPLGQRVGFWVFVLVSPFLISWITLFGGWINELEDLIYAHAIVSLFFSVFFMIRDGIWRRRSKEQESYKLSHGEDEIVIMTRRSDGSRKKL